jgi:hypothetical protein
MYAFMNNKEYTQQELWDMLPLSEEQRVSIIEDFIEENLYDKVDEIIKKQLDEENKREEEFLKSEEQVNSQKEKVI